MKIGFFVIVLLILFSLNGYVMVRGWQALPPGSAIRPTYLITMLLLFMALMAGLIFAYNMPLEVAKIVSFIGYSYLFVFTYLFMSFLAVDVLRIFNYYLHFLPPGMATFRQLAFIVSLIAIFVAMIIGNYKFNHPEVVRLNITAENPWQQKEVKIVAVSDLHLGINIDKKRLQKYVNLINEQNPDIVLMAGDISDRNVQPLINERMIEEFRAIKAPLGIYAINGNHEHYGESPNATANYLGKAGVIFLRDEALLVDNSFYIVGREDRSRINRKKLIDVVKGLDPTKPRILLDHQPYHLEVAKQNQIDLQISGHTHNGQFFPGNLFVKRMYEIGHGYKRKGKTHYYVSSGLGLWGPQYRVGTQSEVVVITMKY